MTRINFEEVDKLTLNRYEAVMIAAQRARQINTTRLHLLERMAEEEIDIDGRKVTSRAMQDLSDGKVDFDRPDELQELVK